MIPLQPSFIKYSHSSAELVCHPYSLLEFIIISFLLLLTLNQRDAVLILILGMRFGSEGGPQHAHLWALLRSVMQSYPYSPSQIIFITWAFYAWHSLSERFSPVLGQRKGPIRPLSAYLNHGGPEPWWSNLYQDK